MTDDPEAVAEHYRTLGELTEIAMHSPVLAEMELRHIGEVFLRPLALGQFRRWRRPGRVISILPSNSRSRS